MWFLHVVIEVSHPSRCELTVHVYVCSPIHVHVCACMGYTYKLQQASGKEVHVNSIALVVFPYMYMCKMWCVCVCVCAYTCMCLYCLVINVFTVPQLYALYKQSTEGPCNEPQPSIFNMTARYKWYVGTCTCVYRNMYRNMYMCVYEHIQCV